MSEKKCLISKATLENQRILSIIARNQCKINKTVKTAYRQEHKSGLTHHALFQIADYFTRLATYMGESEELLGDAGELDVLIGQLMQQRDVNKDGVLSEEEYFGKKMMMSSGTKQKTRNGYNDEL